MLTATEKKNLQNCLAMTEDHEATLSYDELLGFMFGLAITPELILPGEWMALIFGGELPKSCSMATLQQMTGSLMAVYNKYVAAFHNDQLDFPFDLENLQEGQFTALFEWISGFEEALAIREEVWDPEEHPEISEQKKEELYHCMMTLEGLVDPMEAMTYFADLPEELFNEAFSGVDAELADRETRIQLFLLTTLPLTVRTLQEHARFVEKKRQRRRAGTGSPQPIRLHKVERDAPCPCKSGKKYHDCCGSESARHQPSPAKMHPGQAKVIQVDFRRNGRKSASYVPIYQLRVELQDAEPAIWRSIQVPGSITLDRLHTVLQLCMGWQEQHLHQFQIDSICYSIPAGEDQRQTGRTKNEARYSLHQLADKIRPRFLYIYDFGDNWVHRITIEEVHSAPKDKSWPVLLAGQGACPPEDIGGVHHFSHVLEVLKDPAHEDYEEMAGWLDPDDFDPEQFGPADIANINTQLQKIFVREK